MNNFSKITIDLSKQEHDFVVWFARNGALAQEGASFSDVVHELFEIGILTVQENERMEAAKSKRNADRAGGAA